MKKLKLTKNRYTFVDNEDFSQLSKFKWHFISKSYVARSENNREILLHRQLLNAPEELEVDHIDGNPMNNQKNNLRLATHAENIRNRANLNKNNLSGATGVSWFKRDKKWRARIFVSGKEVHLGLFNKKDEAIQKRNIAAKKYYGEFASMGRSF